MRKILLQVMILFLVIPTTIKSESLWEMDPKKYRPSLVPWLLSKKSKSNGFYPEIYLNWKEKNIRHDQQKIFNMITQEKQTGMRQHTRLKYDQQTKVAKNCSISKCSQ